MASSSSPELDQFLVCGLGSLGQHCVVALKEFGVRVVAIDLSYPTDWELSQVPDLLDQFILGDFREPNVLKSAEVHGCRAVLLTASSQQVNVEAAFATRVLNPKARLVVRSNQKNLNQFLAQELGNFIAFEPRQLPSNAFTLAALGNEVVGLFHLDNQPVRVMNQLITKEHLWCGQRFLHELDTRYRRVLLYAPAGQESGGEFYTWQSDTLLQAGDRVVYVELGDHISNESKRKKPNYLQQRWQRFYEDLTSKALFKQLQQWWQSSSQTQVQKVALFCFLTIVFALALGTILFRIYYPKSTFYETFLLTAMLLLGGYSDVYYSSLEPNNLPWWLHLFGLLLTLSGTAFIGVLYALLTEWLISYRFQFGAPRPPVPTKDHTVLVGYGRLGNRVAELLREFRQTFVVIPLNNEVSAGALPGVAVITGNFSQAMPKANLATAKSVVIVTDNEMLNLEIALMVRRINTKAHLVIRTYQQRLSEQLSKVLVNSQVLCAFALAAEAFAGAAFGEKILSLFRVQQQTILVTEYRIEAADTLCGLSIATAAYGYGVVPICHTRHEVCKLMPSEEIILEEGDRLVVLAKVDGLRRIEQRRPNLANKCWFIRVESATNESARFEGANTLARITNCNLGQARDLMLNLPKTLPVPLYWQQASRLVRELGRVQVTAKVITKDKTKTIH